MNYKNFKYREIANNRLFTSPVLLFNWVLDVIVIILGATFLLVVGTIVLLFYSLSSFRKYLKKEVIKERGLVKQLLSYIKEDKRFKRIVEILTDFGITNHILRRVLVSIVTILLALYLVNREEILETTINFGKVLLGQEDPANYTPSYLTIAYYSFLIFWVFYLTYHYARTTKSGDDKLKNAISEVTAAIQNAPNEQAFENATLAYQRVIYFKNIYQIESNNDASIDHYETLIYLHLEIICGYTADFMNVDPSLITANIMPLLEKEKEQYLSEIKNIQQDESVYVYQSLKKLNEIRGFFFTDKNFCYPQEVGEIFDICIPYMDSKSKWQLPGVCKAYLEGEHYIFDTSEIDHEFKELPSEVKEDAVKHFSNRKDYYQSFLSLSLNHFDIKKSDFSTIAVLNINYRGKNISNGPIFVKTMIALLQPVVLNLGELTKKYFDLYYDDIIHRNFRS